MKKGKKVEIKRNANYAGQDVNWTEPVTDRFKLEEDTVMYHYSCEGVKEFRAKETCFFTELVDREAHFYAFVIPAGTMVTEYKDEGTQKAEYRVNITEEMEAYYLGDMVRDSKEYYQKYGQQYVRYTYIDNRISIEEII